MFHTTQESPSFDIDFVLLWVDGGDSAWRAKKAKYLPNVDPADQENGEQRYRDWGLLRYWFRGVEAFAPWVRKVFFVTDDQWPSWLDKNAPKLVCTRHRDFIPPEFLPTFSCDPIELNLHRIKGLSERFVYFNDDTFVGRPISPSTFFREGLPVDVANMFPHIAQVNRPIDHNILNENAVITRHFGGRRFMMKHPGKWFLPWRSGCGPAFWHVMFALLGPCPGFFDPHLPFPFLKSTYEEVWSAEPDLLRSTSLRKFRTLEDVSARLCRKWQYATGRFYPVPRGTTGAYYRLDANGIDPLCNAIKTKRHNLFCANDVAPLPPDVFDSYRDRLAAAFETILPTPSSFEKRESGTTPMMSPK